ncbi:Motile sperm domain-containing protein 2 [Gryganskiella cystojenkinii]|nr:Motile sperm domain-containing protein 2 [Gryganskiella cystojenkinii]
MTLSSSPTSSTSSSQSTTSFLRISPQNFQFTASKVSSGLVSKLKIKNLLSAPVGYKFKTNAPLRYSVKPVLGVLTPGQSIEVFVRCENWVNPQDRFLLQSVALTKEESDYIDATSWKELDRRRIIETFIQCASSSTLALRDPQDDGGSISSSSSSNSSSVTSSVHSSTRSDRSDRSRPQPHTQRSYHHQQSDHLQAPGGGRKMSTSSATSSAASASPPGSYPTLFRSSSKGAATNASLASSNSTSTKVSRGSTVSAKGESVDSPTPSSALGLLAVPVGYLTSKLSNSKQTVRMVSRFLAVRHYTKMQVFTVSVICLLLGLLLPLEKLLVLVGGGTALPAVMNHQHSHDPFQNGGILTTRTAIRASPLSSSLDLAYSTLSVVAPSSEPAAFQNVPEAEHIEVDPIESSLTGNDAPPMTVEVEGSV